MHNFRKLTDREDSYQKNRKNTEQNTTQKLKQQISRSLWHSVRKQGGLMLPH